MQEDFYRMRIGTKLYRRFHGRDRNTNIVFVCYFVIFVIFGLLSLYPICWCLTNSLKTLPEYMESSLSLPAVPQFWHYASLFSEFEIAGQNFFGMLFNSVWQSCGSCFLNVAASALIAYPIAKYNFPGKKLLYGIIIFRITIPIIGSAPAEYRLFRDLNMINNPSLYWMAWLSGFDLSALILYGYFSSISKTYSEAAYIDGANRLQVFLYAVLPQAVPCLVALFINQLLTKWNDYTTAQIYLREFPNLAYGLYVFEGDALFVRDGKTVYFAAVILTSVFPILLYSLGQNVMLENMSVGGIKG